MNCELFHVQVYDYLYELLEDNEKTAFEEHAQRCYSCQEKLQVHRKGIGLLDKWQPEARVVKVENVVKPLAFDLSLVVKCAAILCLVTVVGFAVMHWRDIALLIRGKGSVVDVQVAEREIEKKYKTHYEELQKQLLEEHKVFLSNKSKEQQKLVQQREDLRQQIKKLKETLAQSKGNNTLEEIAKMKMQLQKLNKEIEEQAERELVLQIELNNVKEEITEKEKIIQKLYKESEELRQKNVQRQQQMTESVKEQQRIAKLKQRAKNLREKIPLYRVGSAIRNRFEQELSDVANILSKENKALKSEKERQFTFVFGNTPNRLSHNSKTPRVHDGKISYHSSENNEKHHSSDVPLKGTFNLEQQKIIEKQRRELREVKQMIAAAEKQGVRLDLLYTREKPLDGFITAVSKKLPLVMMSLGSDDNVQKGQEFTIFRGSSYIGTVVVEDVYKDACAARIIKGKTKFLINKGDGVTTRFGGTRGVDPEKEPVKIDSSEINDNTNKPEVVHKKHDRLFQGSHELRQAREQFLPHLTNFDYEKGWGSDAFEDAVKKGEIEVVFPPAWQNEMDRKKAREILDYTAKNTNFNTEAYQRIVENPFTHVMDDPLSTFSIDVDTAAYSNVRRFLSNYQLPPKDAVRIEEMINYFEYDYPQPLQDTPFSVHTEMASCPWNPKNVLLKIGLQGRKLEPGKRPASNLVFLIDVSGSMGDDNKLDLLKRSLQLLVDKMHKSDRVAIVVYAGASGLVLPATTCNNKKTILHALTQLQSGGSTNGGEGIELAYKVAQENFVKDGINRVILATDGDFNVGTTDRGSLTRLIEEKAKSGVFLTVLGFGMGNYKDETLETLADKGNGNYAYIDRIEEAQKVLVQQMHGTLWTIAKDVKIQIEFNPNLVQSYRLIGYENRKLQHRDFNDDTKDAGEIGVGHNVTAFYEISPTSNADFTPQVEALRYQQKAVVVANDKEIAFIKLRYKKPQQDQSSLLQFAIDKNIVEKPSQDFVFASSVVSFGMLLRDSRYKGILNYDMVLDLAKTGQNKSIHRNEFVTLIQKAQVIEQMAKVYKNK